MLSSDDELGPNDATPPRLSSPLADVAHNRNMPSTSSSYTQYEDEPINDSNPILNPILLGQVLN